MNNNLIIEKMKKEDIKVVKLIEQEQNISIISEKNMLEDMNSSQVNYYVLKENNILVGYIAFSYIFENLDIHSIVISKKFQHKGYATYLLNYLFEFSKKNNINNIYLEVRKSNMKAINLYIKLGFKLISIRKRYYPDNFEDAFIYFKEIKS